MGSCLRGWGLFRAVLAGESVGQAQEDRLGSTTTWRFSPSATTHFLVREGQVADDEGLRALNRTIVRLGEEPWAFLVVATGDVHFLDPHDAVYRAHPHGRAMGL